MPETKEAMETGRIEADGKILLESGSCVVAKVAVEHVWNLPGMLAIVSDGFWCRISNVFVPTIPCAAGWQSSVEIQRDFVVFRGCVIPASNSMAEDKLRCACFLKFMHKHKHSFTHEVP